MRIFFIFYFLLFLSTHYAHAVEINVKEWGAKGDGKSNNYRVFLKIADAINKAGSGTIYFPPGDYYIHDFHTKTNNIRDIEFKNIKGLKIYGTDAKLSVNGKFYRRKDYSYGTYNYSQTTAIIPVFLRNCSNVEILDLELDGNADQMMREDGIVESGGHLLYILDSRNVKLNNLKIHHAQSDGIFIEGKISENIQANNIISYSNARQGMSILQLFNSSFNNCSFLKTGKTDGKYGGHAPRAGVDIEPESDVLSVKNIFFTNCIFQDNAGSQFVVSHPQTTQNIFLTNCRFISAKSDFSYAIIVNAKNVVFDRCLFDLKGGNIYPVWQLSGSSSTFKNSYIKSDENAITAASSDNGSYVIFDNNTIEYTGVKPLNSYFPYIQMRNLEFTNNKIIIPEVYQRKGSTTGLIQKAKKIKGNTFYSNGKVIKPIISYDGANVLD